MESDNIDHDAWQELRQAVRRGDTDRVASLLATKPEFVHGDPKRGSLLHFAAGKGRLEIIQLLVQLGANVNEETHLGDAPLEEAATNGHLIVVTFLVNHGANLAAPRPERNPLFSAIYGGHLDVARFLLAAGVDPHVVYRDESGQLMNALSFAQARGRAAIADLLKQAGCRLPVEGADKPVWQPEEHHEPTVADRDHNQIVARMTEEFGPVDPLALQEIVPVHPEVSVAVHVIPPNKLHPYMTLFTIGMSDRPMRVPAGEEAYRYAELVMHLPATWPNPRNKRASTAALWPFQWLRKVAYYPHLHNTWLGGRSTIISSDEPPVPLGPNTKQTCLLLLADFGGWGPIELHDGRTVRFYTVIPLYTEERDFEKRHGVGPLLQRLQERGYTAVVSINRENVARA